MLFVTVYGPELESLFQYICVYSEKQGTVHKQQIYDAYCPHASAPSKGQTKNIDDGLRFLLAARLIEGEHLYTPTIPLPVDPLPFAALVFRQLYQLDQYEIAPLDHLYISLLEQLFILPNRMWVENVHQAVNQLPLAQQLGGISQEKTGAWRRVMEFLGVGYRKSEGFYCLYSPDLILSLLQHWGHVEGTLQPCCEEYLQQWLPCLTAQRDIARSVA